MNEILFAIGAGAETIGVCAPANYPKEAASLPVVASYSGVDAEGIIARGAAACFTIEGMQGEPQLEALKRAPIPVYSYRIDTLAELYECISDVGLKTGHAKQARELAASMMSRITACSTPRGNLLPQAVVIVNIEPLVVAGPASFLSDLLRAAGFRAAFTAHSEAYPAVSLETLAALKPDYLIFPSGDISSGEAQRLVNRLNRMVDKPCLPIEIPADLLVRPGPRTADAVEALSRAREEKQLDTKAHRAQKR
ncbi:MAG: ABC transporter substrate-binding protein [Acidobacteria bacterium]|jgi:iron complex transport system substrate-binding protein|nr:ABC transporter substrate-binding protein [Acidobacteriota bacterium]